MTEAEYREFLSFLFERYVRPRLARVRDRHRHHFEDDFSYHLDQAVRSAQILRFIESYCSDAEDAYRTFRLERLKSAVSETRYSLEFSNRLVDEAGFLDACESHTREIADGLEANQLPGADKDVLREMGSINPEVELRSLVYRAKLLMERSDRQSREVGLRQELRYAEERLKEADAEFQRHVTAQGHGEETPEEVLKKSRRWFKGLGQISQGAALSIANVALAIGTLKLPVSPETQTWGAMASVATGIGTILSGIGDLRNE
ncbi:MAG TPA: hypothetical protein VFB82_22110 [Blastocatellia bacterium]|nr:hypothetical protein [Blastocatellia bacterium]